MNEKITKRAAANPLSHVPAVVVAPPMRCFRLLENSDRRICGELASWVRPGRDWFNPEYFCELHRKPGDAAIAPEHILRRVRINVDVMFSAVAVNAPAGHTEAVAQLEAAVHAAGGVTNINAVTSHVVKSCPPPAPGWKFEPPGEG